ncbi:MAG TPA: PIN domain-containing protein [Rhizomicrobium sp.]
MCIALDTNLLIYAEGLDDLSKQAAAKALLTGLSHRKLIVSVQVLGEAYNVLVRKGKTRAEARAAVQLWQNILEIAGTPPELMAAALDLATGHKFKIWDALILAAAAEAGCSLLISEDFRDGFARNGVTVANPFATPHHPLLAAALARP